MNSQPDSVADAEPSICKSPHTHVGATMVVLAFVMSVVIVGPSSQTAEAFWPQVWIGSPVNAQWYANPAYHHKLVRASPRNDWAVDLSGGSSTDRNAYVYAAVSNASDSRLTARVKQIIDNNACINGGGGDLVTIEFVFDRTVMGQVTYAHLNRSGSLRVGQSISRWGGYLGNVSLSEGGGPNCWTGPHIHMELRASQDYSCWNKGYRIGSRVNRTNFVGFISGSALARYSRECP